jgi:selenocysteine lyase/cysteine desulfurase
MAIIGIRKQQRSSSLLLGCWDSDKIGIARIEEHTVGLALQLYDGLSKQGHSLFTPAGNRSSIVTFYCTRPPVDVRRAFAKANIEVTVRSGQVGSPLRCLIMLTKSRAVST